MNANGVPTLSEMINEDKLKGVPLIAKSTMVPQSGPNVAPVIEKPITVFPLADIIKPAVPASPPEAADAVAPSMEN